MQKLLNGELVDLTEAEIAEIRKPLPDHVPGKVTRMQAMQALFLDDSLDKVQGLIDAIPDVGQKRMAQIYWDEAQEFERDHPMVIQICEGLGKDDAGRDALFVTAGKIV